MAIPEPELNKVIKSAKLGPRSAKRLRDANAAQAAEEAAAVAAEEAARAAKQAKKPRGHGSPAPAIASLGDDF